MIRYLKYLFLAVIAVCLVIIAVANRDIVTLRLIHDDLAAWTGGTVSVDLPLFLIVFGGIVIGLLIGFVWEWFREHRHRVDAKTHRRKSTRLQQEVETLKGRTNEGKDEILTLLEDGRASR